MSQLKEIRFTTFLDEHTECEVYATIENGAPVIQTVNVLGDCVVTFEDLDELTKEFFMNEARRHAASGYSE